MQVVLREAVGCVTYCCSAEHLDVTVMEKLHNTGPD